jgi:hypothetical protein
MRQCPVGIFFPPLFNCFSDFESSTVRLNLFLGLLLRAYIVNSDHPKATNTVILGNNKPLVSSSILVGEEKNQKQ